MSKSSEEDTTKKKGRFSRARDFLRGRSSAEKRAAKKAAQQEAMNAQDRERTKTLGPGGMVSVAKLQEQAKIEQQQREAKDRLNLEFIIEFQKSGMKFDEFMKSDAFAKFRKAKEGIAREDVNSFGEVSFPKEQEIPELIARFTPAELEELKNATSKATTSQLQSAPTAQEVGEAPPIPTSLRPGGGTPPPIPSSPRPNQRGPSPTPTEDSAYASADEASADDISAEGEYAKVNPNGRILDWNKPETPKNLSTERHMSKFNLSFYGDDIPIGKMLYNKPASAKEELEGFYNDYTKTRALLGAPVGDSFTIDHAYQVYSNYLFSERFSADFKGKGSYTQRMKETSDPSAELDAIAKEAGIPEDKIEMLRKSYNNSTSIPIEYRVFDKETSRMAEKLLGSDKFKEAIEQESQKLYNKHSKRWKIMMELDEKGCMEYAKNMALGDKEIISSFDLEEGISDYLKLKFEDKEPRILGQTQRSTDAPSRSQSTRDPQAPKPFTPEGQYGTHLPGAHDASSKRHQMTMPTVTEYATIVNPATRGQSAQQTPAQEVAYAELAPLQTSQQTQADIVKTREELTADIGERGFDSCVRIINGKTFDQNLRALEGNVDAAIDKTFKEYNVMKKGKPTEGVNVENLKEVYKMREREKETLVARQKAAAELEPEYENLKDLQAAVKALKGNLRGSSTKPPANQPKRPSTQLSQQGRRGRETEGPGTSQA